MSSTISQPTGHEDLIHDAQLDYYGLRLATCSSDRLVKIFNVRSENGAAPKIEFASDLMGHTGPVWEIAWAHPRWGTLLASCGYDGLVLVHRETDANTWEEAYRFSAKGSVNSIEWCPSEYGLALACASSDGHFYILRCDATTGEWTQEFSLQAHYLGCNAITWAPYGALGSLSPDGHWILRVATGGADSKVKIFKCTMDQEHGTQWDAQHEQELSFHKGTVRDVSWAPSIGLPYNLLASCSEDGTVCIWSQENENDPTWAKEVLPDFKAPVWRVAWSVTGSLLAVSSGDADVTLWKESLEQKKWIKISEVKDEAAPSTIPADKPKGPTGGPAAPASQEMGRPQQQQDTMFGAPSQQQPAAEPASDAPAAETAPDVLRPQKTWEGVSPEAVEVQEAATEQAPAEQQQEQGDHGQPSEQYPPGSEQPTHEGQGTDYSAQQQYGEYAQQGEQYAYDQQGQWDYSQQQGGYAEQQQWGDQQQYAAEGGWDTQQQQGWGEQQTWDPNQQQQYEGQYAGYEQQSGEAGYADPNAGWDQGQQYSQEHQQAAGLAAPPLYAGGVTPPSQPSGQFGAPPHQGQQPW